MLLVLDNLEQVIEVGARAVPACSRPCPNLRCWSPPASCCASRARSSTRYRHSPTGTRSSSSAQRSQVEPSSPIVEELCRRLDRTATRGRARGRANEACSPPSRSSTGSAQRLDLLQGGRDADPRQQTLRATIEWSYDLLAPSRSSRCSPVWPCSPAAARSRPREEVCERRPRHAPVAGREEPCPPHRRSLLDAGDDPRAQLRTAGRVGERSKQGAGRTPPATSPWPRSRGADSAGRNRPCGLLA